MSIGYVKMMEEKRTKKNFFFDHQTRIYDKVNVAIPK